MALQTAKSGHSRYKRVRDEVADDNTSNGEKPIDMKKIEIGDIFEINTPEGKAYLHYVYIDDTKIELLRVMPGLYLHRPDNFELLVKAPESFLVRFPVAAAYRKKIVEKVAHYPIGTFSKPKFMRSIEFRQEEFMGWYIVNTETLQRKLVKELNAEQKKLSPFGIWNDTLLIEKLATGWSLDQWNNDPTSL